MASHRQPGLFLTGNYFTGPAVATCVAEAMEVAARMHRFLASEETVAAANAGQDQAAA